MEPITIIGAGLAGCEAAWQIAKRGERAVLYEMKPEIYSPAHRSPFFAELVCSNSFKSESFENASGILKEEMGQLESLILKVAKEARVPAGDSLAVDREVFSKTVTQILESLENVEVIRKEVSSIPSHGIVIIATGPLTSDALIQEIQKVAGAHHLFFYDAISPIVTADSIKFQKAFKSSRYGKGGEDYINCPLNQEEYYRFVEALNQAEKMPVQQFEKRYLFEGCLPIEEMAERGRETLAHGPLKPVGLVDPKTGKQPFAVVQLRQEDRFKTLFNLVGFQTRLMHEEQKRVFYPSQYLYRFPPITEGIPPTEESSDSLFCRTDHWGRGIYGIYRHGSIIWNQCLSIFERDSTCCPPAYNRHGCIGPLYHPFPQRPLPAHEHQLRFISSFTGEEQGEGETTSFIETGIEGNGRVEGDC